MQRDRPSERGTDSRRLPLTRSPRPLVSLAFAVAVPLVVVLVLSYGHAAMAAASSLLLVRVARRRLT